MEYFSLPLINTDRTQMSKIMDLFFPRSAHKVCAPLLLTNRSVSIGANQCKSVARNN